MAPRTWLITGCSSGFGRQLAEVALERGDAVVATARRPMCSTTSSRRVRTACSPCPSTSPRPTAIAAAVAAAEDRFGGVDVLVNNAGFGSVGAIEEVEPEHLRDVMETMFFGPVALTQAVLPGMRARGSGAVVQMSSMGGQLSPPGFGAYCAAKFALEAASESLAAEVAPFGMRVLIVEPGSFRTGFAGARLHRSPSLPGYARPWARTASSSTGSTAARRATRGKRPRRSRRRSTRTSRRSGSRSAATPSRRSAARSRPASTNSPAGSRRAAPPPSRGDARRVLPAEREERAPPRGRAANAPRGAAQPGSASTCASIVSAPRARATDTRWWPSRSA